MKEQIQRCQRLALPFWIRVSSTSVHSLLVHALLFLHSPSSFRNGYRHTSIGTRRHTSLQSRRLILGRALRLNAGLKSGDGR